ncbi:MAG TPA: hypothetical protein VFZ64_10205 [Nocardioidaceae bacterium]
MDITLSRRSIIKGMLGFALVGAGLGGATAVAVELLYPSTATYPRSTLYPAG